MRDRLDELHQHCADVGVQVIWEDLGPKKRGEFRWWTNTIVLSVRLDTPQTIATLGHEFGHWRFGDTCSTPAVERRAWEYAAALLITPDEYAAAEQLAGHTLGGLAVELGVTPKLVEAWRRWWGVRGQHLRPEHLRRIGHGDDDGSVAADLELSDRP